jgi:hypothetical protein
VGLACIIVAIIGGRLKVTGLGEIPPIKSFPRQALLGILGGILILVCRQSCVNLMGVWQVVEKDGRGVTDGTIFDLVQSDCKVSSDPSKPTPGHVRLLILSLSKAPPHSAQLFVHGLHHGHPRKDAVLFAHHPELLKQLGSR